ncbi:hypothetical protein [Methanobrevibacter sp.]|uniref:hypothetical protein n=1 Tax=Methanobrevibacter sp. TaxID=66852 RepID=UPI00386A75FC
MTEKSPAIAMILSFLFTGVGIIYLGNSSKGLGLLAIGIICNILGMFVLGFLHYISIITWFVSLYLTYKESQIKKPEPQYPRRVFRRYE